METELETSIRRQLLDRRHRLEHLVRGKSGSPELMQLLELVDDALGRLSHKAYGLCELCGGTLDDDQVLDNPLAYWCLCDLTPERLQVLESDLGLAARIQSSLLPMPDDCPEGWCLHYRFMPAGPVSGDFCGVLGSGNGRGGPFVLLGDVSGKGFAAGLLMAHLSASFRALAEHGSEPTILVNGINRLLVASSLPTHYATLVCAALGSDGTFDLCNAGHCPPLIVRRHEMEELRATGLPVGMTAGGSWESCRISTEPGDLLVLYTDGLSEARNAAGEEFGAERIARVVRDLHGQKPSDVVSACVEGLEGFLEGIRTSDDLTLMVLRREG